MILFIIFSFTGALMVVFGAVVRFKKAYMLISGINTSSPERRAKMDLDKICNVVGNTLMAGGLLWIAAGVLYWRGIEIATLIMTPVLVIGIIAMMFYIQKYDHNSKDVHGKITKSKKIVYALMGLGSMIAVALFGGMMYSSMKTPEVILDTGRLTVKGFFGCTIDRGEAVSVTLTETLQSMNRTMGYGGGGYIKGLFSSKELGRGHAYLKTNSPPYIYMKLNGGNGTFLYINLHDKAKTEELHEKIQKWLG